MSNGARAKNYITLNTIPRKYAFRLGSVWYDVRSLRKWVEAKLAEGVAPTVPHTRKAMNTNQLNSLRRRVKILYSKRPLWTRGWDVVKRIPRNTLAGLHSIPLSSLERNSSWGHH
jgi:hypothetical protein